MADERRVSVVIPAHNAARWIGDAIAGVLAQTHAAAECIVVDDGSADGTSVIAASFHGVRVIAQANAGVAAARNAGAAAATGDLLAFLDADDAWVPRRLEAMLGAQGDVVLSAAAVCDADLRPLGPIRRLSRPLDVPRLLLGNPELVSCSSNLLIARRAFAQLGGFDERLSTSADWDLLARLLARGPLAYVDEPLTLYRLHRDNMSVDVALMEHDMLLAYAALFARSPQLAPLRRRAYANLLRVIAGSYFAARPRQWRRFADATWRSVSRHPAVLGYYARLPLRLARRHHARRHHARRHQARRHHARRRMTGRVTQRPLVVAHVIDTAGPHRYFDTLAAHADPARQRMIVGCVGPPGPLQDAMRAAEVPTFALGARGAPRPALRVGALARVARAQASVNVVQVHLPDGALVGLAAARLARTPDTVFTAHHSHELPFHGVKLRAIDWLCAGVLADHTSAPSAAVARTLTELARVAPSRIDVIHHGFDLARFAAPVPGDGAAVRAQLGLDGGPIATRGAQAAHGWRSRRGAACAPVVIGAIARNYRLKNLDGLVRAFALVAGPAALAAGDAGAAGAAAARDARLLIVGGGDHEPLRALARQLGVADRIVLCGPREDIPDVIAAMDALVQPSLAESFGMVDRGDRPPAVPSSAPRSTAPEVIEPGVNGLLARSGKPHDLADALRELLACRARWPQMGAAARVQAQCFPVAGMVSAYEERYERWFYERRFYKRRGRP